MASVKEVTVVINGQEFVTPAAHKAGNSLESFGEKASGVFKGLIALAAAAALGEFFKKSIEEAQNSREAMGQLELAVNNSGASFKNMAPKIDETLSKLASMTKFQDDDFARAMQQMTLKTGDAGWSLKNLGQAADLAAAASIPLEQSAEVLAKAHEGNTKALFKLVPELRHASNWSEMLAQKTHDAAEAQMRQLGPTAAITKQFGEFQESVGKAILGNSEFTEGGFGLADMLGNLANWVTANAKAMGPYIAALVDAGRNIVESVGPAFSAFGPIAKASFEMFVFAIHLGSTGIRAFSVFVQSEMGKIYEFLGDTGLKIAATLKKLGVTIGTETLATLKEYGSKQQTTATENWKRLEDDDAAYKARALGATLDNEGKKLKAVGDSASQRQAIQKADIAAQKKERDAEQKEIEEIIKVTKATWKLVDDSVASYKDILKTLPPAVKAGMTTVHVDGMNKALQDMHVSGDAAMKSIAEKAGPLSPIVKTITQNVVGVSTALSNSVSNVLAVASEFGGLDGKAQAALGSILKVNESLVQGLTGKGIAAFTGWAGVIGGLMSVGNMIFSGGAEHRALLAKNSEQLEKIRTEGISLSTKASGQTIASARGFLGQFNATDFLNKTSIGSGYKGDPMALFAGELAKFGLRISDLDSIASDLGMSLKDSKGKFSIDALGQLFSGLQTSGLGTIGQSFTEQLKFFRESQRLSGSTGSGKIQDLLSFLTGAGGASALGGLDASSPESARSSLFALFGKLNNGGVDAGSMGRLSGSQFRDIIVELIDALDGLKTGTASSASSASGTVEVAGVGAVSTGGVTETVQAVIKSQTTALYTVLTAQSALQTQIAQNTADTVTRLDTVITLLGGSAQNSMQSIDEGLEARRRNADAYRGVLPVLV